MNSPPHVSEEPVREFCRAFVQKEKTGLKNTARDMILYIRGQVTPPCHINRHSTISCEGSYVSASLKNLTWSTFLTVGSENGRQTMACGNPLIFVNKVLWEQPCPLVHVLSMVAFMTELSCDRNSQACQAKNLTI